MFVNNNPTTLYQLLSASPTVCFDTPTGCISRDDYTGCLTYIHRLATFISCKYTSQIVTLPLPISVRPLSKKLHYVSGVDPISEPRSLKNNWKFLLAVLLPTFIYKSVKHTFEHHVRRRQTNICFVPNKINHLHVVRGVVHECLFLGLSMKFRRLYVGATLIRYK
mgnify:FL=1